MTSGGIGNDDVGDEESGGLQLSSLSSRPEAHASGETDNVETNNDDQLHSNNKTGSKASVAAEQSFDDDGGDDDMESRGPDCSPG